MCGIAGFLDRTKNHESDPLGRVVLSMLEALSCRGPDSAGVALYGLGSDSGYILRVKLGDGEGLECRSQQLKELLRSVGVDSDQFKIAGPYGRIAVNGSIEVEKLIDSIETLGQDMEVISAGRKLEIIKQVGSPANLENTYRVSQFSGTHGIGHTRLSTESRVDLSHSQPFWSHQRLDLAVVHNGHITNYHQLRRRYQQSGIRFYTENDSEVVAIYLADQLGRGRSLEQSLIAMLRDLDGSFSCLAATGSALAFVKDRFSLKPLLFAETDSFVALANEEVAIRAALRGNYQVREAQAREVRLWQR
jgi:glutamate synthase domain-containing protein 1